MFRLTALVVIAAMLTALAGPVSPARAVGLTQAEEEKMGRQMMVALRATIHFAGDRDLDDYISSVGNNLARHSGAKDFHPRFYLIVDPALNAFAGPGGVIVVTTGLVEIMDTVDELAGVLSHEIAHATRRHISKQIEQQKKISLLSVAGMLAGVVLGVATGSAGLATAGMMGSAAAAQTKALSYSREHEIDADRVGTRVMIKAGYDLYGQLSLLEKMEQAQDMMGVAPPQYLSTHPGLKERIAFLKNIRERGAIKPDRVGAETFEYFLARVSGYSGKWEWFDGKTGTLAEYGKGISLMAQDNNTDALPYLSRVHRDVPVAISPLVDYVRCLRLLGRPSEGLAVLNRAAPASPYRTSILFWQGQMNLDMERPSEAVRIYQQLVRLHPDDPQILRNLGLGLGRMGRLAEAHDALARSYIQMGQIRKARQNFDIALRHAKTDSEREAIKRHRAQAMELLPEGVGGP